MLEILWPYIVCMICQCKMPLTQVKSCSMCGTTETSEWRKGPLGPRTLCNACSTHRRRCRNPTCARCKGKGNAPVRQPSRHMGQTSDAPVLPSIETASPSFAAWHQPREDESMQRSQHTSLMRPPSIVGWSNATPPIPAGRDGAQEQQVRVSKEICCSLHTASCKRCACKLQA